MRLTINCLLLCSLTLVACASQETAESPKQPNVLWIVSEDNSAWLGSYGDQLATTPRLDARIAPFAAFEPHIIVAVCFEIFLRENVQDFRIAIVIQRQCRRQLHARWGPNRALDVERPGQYLDTSSRHYTGC